MDRVPLIFERSRTGRAGVSLPACDVAEVDLSETLPPELLRDDAPLLPEVSELDVVRHYTELSHLNYGVDTGFYPLGSCTMKYNPKVNDWAAGLSGFEQLHPLQPDHTVQGVLEALKDLERWLLEITGMDAMSLQPAAGAQGEFTGILVILAYLKNRGQDQRTVILVPDSAHGTNPATASMAGCTVKVVPSNQRGQVDVDALRALVDENVAGLMLTNPNTLGIFESDILEIAEIVHQAGGLLYYDGANANAILGKVRPGDMGFDVVHLNLHKTFSTPHGGGGSRCWTRWGEVLAGTVSAHALDQVASGRQPDLGRSRAPIDWQGAVLLRQRGGAASSVRLPIDAGSGRAHRSGRDRRIKRQLSSLPLAAAL